MEGVAAISGLFSLVGLTYRIHVRPAWRENFANPLIWSLLINPSAVLVLSRIRQNVLGRDAQEAWRLKESYKDTFAMEAVAVSTSIFPKA